MFNARTTVNPVRIEDGNDLNNYDRKKIQLCFGITNARSLWKKMISLADNMSELELGLCIVTETWFYNSPALDRLVCDAEHGQALGMINNVRKPIGRLNTGGGVSIVFDKNKLSGKRFNIRTNGAEIVVGQFKLREESRTIFVVGIYLSTRLSKNAAVKHMNTLTCVISQLKTSHDSPYILVGGDFNHFDTSSICEDFEDLRLVQTLPTRGNKTIDLAFTNLPVAETVIRPPLRCDETQTDSDHKLVTYSAEWQHSHKFEWIITRGRKMTEENVQECIARLNDYPWEEHITSESPSEIADQLHATLLKIADETMPWKTYKKRSTDDPWIDDPIRKVVNKRRAVYRNRGRDCKDWHELKDKSEDMIGNAKKKWYEGETEKLMDPGSNRLAYAALSDLGTAERSGKRWQVMDTRPGKNESEVAEELADHYSQISQEYPPLNAQRIPRTYDREITPPTEPEVIERLISMKKPKSYVTIDLPPKIVTATARSIGPVLTRIIRGVLEGRGWPQIWKNEEVTTIPKHKHAEDFDSCRGISCTSIYSKLTETYMLDCLREEVQVGETQFGGLRGVGTDHMLAEMTTKILEDLDDNRGVVNVMSIDYQKAFNRMHHQQCLETLAKKGSSNQALAIAASFLGGRTMRAKVGSSLSSVRDAPGGAPQGTKSGNYFFTVSIDDVDRERETEENKDGTESDDLEDRGGLDGVDETEIDGTTERPGTPNTSTDMDEGGRKGAEEDSEDMEDLENSMNVCRRDLRTLKRSEAINKVLEDTIVEEMATQAEYEENLGLPPRWEKRPPWVFKYVDDITIGGRNVIQHGTSHITTAKESKKIHAGDLEGLFGLIEENSTAAGMRVNPKKTQLLCVSGAKNYDVDSYVDVGDVRITSGETLKVLGFTIDKRCSMAAHVRHLKKKFASRIWIIRNLKRAKLGGEKLIRVYCSLIRPCLEYAAAVFHSMLTAGQVLELERLQSIALKTILGWDKSYRSCLAIAKLQSLAERRFELCKRFAQKTNEKERFAHWFPANDPSTYDLRRQEKFRIEFARHERLKKAPLHYMRRLMNDLEQVGEVDYGGLDGW